MFSPRRVPILIAIVVASCILFLAFQKGIPGTALPLANEPGVHPGTIQTYDAIGDSITLGSKFKFSVDSFGHPVRTRTAFQGWPEVLGQMLTAQTGSTTTVSNDGHPGDRAATARVDRLPTLLRARMASDIALLSLGTNDSSGFNTTVSGHGCVADDCDNTFKGNMLEIISALQGGGRDSVHIALIPPVWGSDNESLYANPLSDEATRNRVIQEYNRVIRREISIRAGVELGPDFFSCFLSPTVNRFSLFESYIHPNALGYVMMAALWRDAIVAQPTGDTVIDCSPPVYLLESLDPYVHGHKQNLLGVGSQYYTDESFVLTNIPGELANGIWVSQANADNAATDVEFVSFDVGELPVSVYIAYDASGDPPLSTTHEFVATSLSAELMTSDPLVGVFSLVVATEVRGRVSFGGNKSAASLSPQQGYLIVVIP